jgi:outer membrane protein assembly factor BamB
MTPTLAIIGGEDRALEARTLTDGARAWTAAASVRQLAADGGRIFGLDDRSIHAFDETSGATLWTAAVDPGTRFLTAAAGQLIVVSDGFVRALGPADGAERWRVASGVRPITPAAVSPTQVALGLEDQTVLSLEPGTGAARWRARMDTVPQAVDLAGTRVLVGLPRLAACALDERNGRIDWCTYKLRVPSVGRPAVDERQIYLALLDGTLRTLDQSGTLVRTVDLQGRPTAGPSPIGPDLAVPVSGNEIVIVSSGGRVGRVPPPAGAQIVARVGVVNEPRAIASLASTLRLNMTLSLLRPASPPPPPPAPAASPSPPATPTVPGSAPDTAPPPG